jgi:hypothetical protein
VVRNRVPARQTNRVRAARRAALGAAGKKRAVVEFWWLWREYGMVRSPSLNGINPNYITKRNNPVLSLHQPIPGLLLIFKRHDLHP